MPIEEKELLMSEIRTYNGDLSLIDVLISLFDSKTRVKTLINNKTGIIGNLLDKYKNSLDDDILIEVCVASVLCLFEDCEKNISDCILKINKLGLCKDLEYIEKEILKDKRICSLLIYNGYDVSDEMLECLKENSNDKSFYLDLLVNPNATWVIEYASDELKNDKELMLEAVQYSGEVFKFVSDDLKKDKEFILDVLGCSVSSDASFFQYVDGNIRNDKEFLKIVVKINPNTFSYIDEKIKNDIDFVEELIKIEPTIFKDCNEKIRNNFDIAFSVIMKNDYLISFVGSELLHDYEFMLKCFSSKFNTFHLINRWGEAIKCDYDFFLNAIRYDKRLLKPICSYYGSYEVFMLEATKIDLDALNYIGYDLRNNVGFILDLISLGIEITINDDMYNKVNEIYNS